MEWKSGKAKRVRTIFTPEQLERLEAEFERQQYMVGTERSVSDGLVELHDVENKRAYMKWYRKTRAWLTDLIFMEGIFR